MKSRFIPICLRATLSLLVMLLTASTAWADVSGNCGDNGDNVTYSYVQDTQTLTISGTGAMADFTINYVPWENCHIASVIIEDGVTYIGEFAFNYCTYLASVSIPNSVTAIGAYAFQDCRSLDTLILPEYMDMRSMSMKTTRSTSP